MMNISLQRLTQLHIRTICLTVALLALHGCSAQHAYRMLQEQGRQNCELQPIPLQESCREKYGMEYEEYERLRDQEGLTEKR